MDHVCDPKHFLAALPPRPYYVHRNSLVAGLCRQTKHNLCIPLSLTSSASHLPIAFHPLSYAGTLPSYHHLRPAAPLPSSTIRLLSNLANLWLGPMNHEKVVHQNRYYENMRRSCICFLSKPRTSSSKDSRLNF